MALEIVGSQGAGTSPEPESMDTILARLGIAMSKMQAYSNLQDAEEAYHGALLSGNVTTLSEKERAIGVAKEVIFHLNTHEKCIDGGRSHPHTMKVFAEIALAALSQSQRSADEE